MDEKKIRQIFRNQSDCYADTGMFDNDGGYNEGDVIQAMTEDRFVEVVKEILSNNKEFNNNLNF